MSTGGRSLTTGARGSKVGVRTGRIGSKTGKTAGGGDAGEMSESRMLSSILSNLGFGTYRKVCKASHELEAACTLIRLTCQTINQRLDARDQDSDLDSRASSD